MLRTSRAPAGRLVLLLASFAALVLALLAGGARSAGTPAGLIAFTRSDGIYVMRADGTGVRPLRRGPPASQALNLDWSPDGQKLAFEGGGAMWVMSADGKHLARVLGSADPGQGHSPTWSPDGRRIAFSFGKSQPTDPREDKVIWVMNADGTKVRRLMRLPTPVQTIAAARA